MSRTSGRLPMILTTSYLDKLKSSRQTTCLSVSYGVEARKRPLAVLETSPSPGPYIL